MTLTWDSILAWPVFIEPLAPVDIAGVFVIQAVVRKGYVGPGGCGSQ